MGAHLERGRLLLGQSRHPLAEEEFRLELAENPESAEAHALLALCLAAQEKFDPATQEARRAVALAPDSPFAHYALAHVYVDRRMPDEALASAQEAVRLDPDDADFYALVARILFGQRKWQETVVTAETGLRIDPEHVGCNNLRAMGLVKLGRREEAGRTLEAALSRDPEDALSHANRGWTLLEGGDPTKALEHFREALRLRPDMEWARLGIVEALKSRNFVYRLLLKYFFWMSKLSGRAQLAVLVGGYVGFQALRRLRVEGTVWEPAVTVLECSYILFALMTWIARPLFNLTLRVNRFGRLALSREEIVASNWIGACVFLAIASLVAWFATGRPIALEGAAAFGLLIVPLGATFGCSEGWPRRAMAGFTGALFALFVSAVILERAGTLRTRGLFHLLLTALWIGTIAAPWVGNVLMAMRPRR